MSFDYAKPDYDRAIFRILPTIFLENFKIELEEPHKDFVFKVRSLRNNFFESDTVLLIIYDALPVSALEGKMLEFWKENNGEVLSSIVPTLTGPAILSINAGLPPELLGVMNTKIFVPEIGNFVNILKGYASGSQVTLEDAGVRIRNLLWERPIVDYLPDDYIVFDLLPNEISDSKGLRAFYGYRSKSIPFNNEIDAAYILRKILQYLDKKKEKAFIVAYFSGVDTVAHNHGVGGSVWKDILELYYWLSTLIIRFIDESKRSVVAYFISDHGLENIHDYVELNKDQLEAFLTENNITMFSKSGRFAMIYADEIDIEGVEKFFDNKIRIVGTDRIIKDFWPLADKDKFLERAGKYTVLFKRNSDIFVSKPDNLAENPKIAELIEELRHLKANHGTPTKEELEAFFACYTNK